MFPTRWCCWWTLCSGGATCQASLWDKVLGLALKSSVVAGYALRLSEEVGWALQLGQPLAVLCCWAWSLAGLCDWLCDGARPPGLHGNVWDRRLRSTF